MSLVMPWASVKVSRESVCCVMIKGVNRVQKIRNTWTLGVVQAIRVLCDFRPSLFSSNVTKSLVPMNSKN
jgi:hypothetical protein